MKTIIYVFAFLFPIWSFAVCHTDKLDMSIIIGEVTFDHSYLTDDQLPFRAGEDYVKIFERENDKNITLAIGSFNNDGFGNFVVDAKRGNIQLSLDFDHEAWSVDGLTGVYIDSQGEEHPLAAIKHCSFNDLFE